MSRIILYHQLDITNKNDEIEYLKNLSREEFFILGLEITNPQLLPSFHMSLDPQHEINSNNKTTCIEYVYNHKESLIGILSKYEKIVFVTIKTDVDSIGSIVILSLLLENKFNLTGDMIYRLKAIAKSDKHGRLNWKIKSEDNFYFENYNLYGLPIGLPYMTSDYKIDMNQKIKNLIEYLNYGNFKDLNKYNSIVTNNIKKQKKSIICNQIIPNKLCFIDSKYRGALSYGYKYAPVVIAKNSTYIFNKNIYDKIIGDKITIAQYSNSNKQYINMKCLLKELNNIEKGWGGSEIIIGSPQDKPCILDENIVIELTKKHLNF